MGVTIRQIADAAGVSRGTVDRALNNRGRINPEVSERIKRIADELGYQPNQLGRALSMSKNKIKIGVILQNPETPFMIEVLKGVENAKAEVGTLGCEVVICKVSHNNVRETINTMEQLKAEGAKAIAMVPVEDEEVKLHINLFVEEYEIPIVTFNSDIQDTERLCFVGQNSLQCGRAAAGLMGELIGANGKVAVISGYSTNPSLNNRVIGFCGEIKKQYPGIQVVDLEYCYEDNEVAEKVTKKVLDKHPNLTGIYMTSHGEEGVCKALRSYRKTNRIKMIANDFMGKNYELLESGIINLLIGQDAFVQGYEPVMILFRLLFHGEQPKGEFQYTDIIIRNAYTIPE
ncbi:MAG TPA: LacI family DNA-binding transcriptional regulator [Candidatus Pelethocola excrementipullorum]|nr:LacI family DNA-binding transcriptional regulator [Candidatus Pelethocola excrementipullorum]